jgi:type II secretory pathway pseudopilin PulG
MPKRSLPVRAGFTLLEVIIAGAIMVTLVASLLEAWSSSMNYSFMVNENLRRMEALNTVQTTLAQDFSQSAQFIKSKDLGSGLIVADDSEPTPLYPKIFQEGREIRFVRFRTTVSASASPSNEASYIEDLLRSDAHALSAFASAPVSPYFIINAESGIPGYWNISPVWESDLSGLTFAQNADPVNLRIYRYVLAPYASIAPSTLPDSTTWATTDYPAYAEVGPTIRRGMLLRQYRNANSTTWNTLGLPLSDSIVFDVTNAEYPATALPCFRFTSSFDGVTRTGSEDIPDNEVRLKLTFVQETAQHGPPVQYDLRLSFPFRRIDFGE